MTAYTCRKNSSLALPMAIVFVIAVLFLASLASTLEMGAVSQEAPIEYGIIALPGDILLRTRADRHVETKHGVSARRFLQEKGFSEVWFSQERETFLLVRGNGNGLCALAIVGGRGLSLPTLQRPWGRGEIRELLSGRLEITSYWVAQQRLARLVARDGYRLLWPSESVLVPGMRAIGGAK